MSDAKLSSGREVTETLPGFHVEPAIPSKRRRKKIYHIDKKALGKAVKAARFAAGWNKLGDQGKCEVRLGFSQGVLSGIETGKSGMSMETLIPICVEFHTLPDVLLGLPNTMPPPGGPSNGKGVPWKKAIGPRVDFCMKIRKLSPRQLAEITGLSVGTIHAIARGDDSVSVETLGALSLALEVPAWWLLGFPSFGSNDSRPS